MPKAFGFEFATDDILESTQAGDCAESESSQVPPREDAVPPQLHLLQDVSSSSFDYASHWVRGVCWTLSCTTCLIVPYLQLLSFPSQFSFGIVTIHGNDSTGINVPRRDLHDIRAQLMAEDGILSGDSVAGLSADDIIPNAYEGGFKTWECSVDLSHYVCASMYAHEESFTKDTLVVELGAGTALPSLTILRKWLLRHSSHSERAPKLQLCLTDYNRSVLELATVPNLYLVTQFCDQPISGTHKESGSEDLEHFKATLFRLGIDVSLISGSWTPDFVDMIPSISRSSLVDAHDTLILASETIYSPAATRMFTQVLLSILRKTRDQGSNAKALVAAKRMYFGVGGGVDEFLQVLEELGGRGSVVWETQGSGVARVIIAVTLNAADRS